MWGVNQDLPLLGQSTFGRGSFGALHQPRLAWKNAAINLEHDPYPDNGYPFTDGPPGWIVEGQLTVQDASTAALSVGVYMNATANRDVTLSFGKFAARLRFVFLANGLDNGLTEFVTYAVRLNTIHCLQLELLVDGVVTSQKILHESSFFQTRATSLLAGFCYVYNELRFIAWASSWSDWTTQYGIVGQRDYGAGTATASAVVENVADVFSGVRTISGADPVRLACGAEHYGLIPSSHIAIPEESSALLARLYGPPGSLRQRQQNALLQVSELPVFDCGQMIELSRNSAESPFFVGSLAAYDKSEEMPYLPEGQASNVHHESSVNEQLQMLRVDVDGTFTNVLNVSESIVCTNDGSGLNEYRGTSASGGTTTTALVSVLRQDRRAIFSSGANLDSITFIVAYVLKIAIRATNSLGSDAVSGVFLLTNTQAENLFSGEPVSLGGLSGYGGFLTGQVFVTAIGPA